jgi:formylglycine-generating enzyme required for sulfatase activity
MKRKRIILVALAAVLVAVAGIAVWRLLSPEPVPKPTGLSAPIELVEIQPGEFLMGSPEDEEGRDDDETQHLVRITNAFGMGKYEVTQKQWREVMGTTIQQQRDKAQRESGRSEPPLGQRLGNLVEVIRDDPSNLFAEIKSEGLWETFRWLAVGPKNFPIYGRGDDYPMYYVSWEEAVEFCRRLTDLERAAGRLPVGHVYRLPTEAEWEYACRAGSTTRFANGNAEADLDKIGWYGGNSGGTSHPVGMKLPNAWGLHDMHGNVWEWCLDWYGDYPSDSVMDPRGTQSGSDRVLRGGSWGYGAAADCRSAQRGSWLPSYNLSPDESSSLGFRVSLAPPVPAAAP